MSIVINDITPLDQFIATASQTVFNVAWTVDVITDVVVYARAAGASADDTADLISASNYTVTLIGGTEAVRVTFSVGRTEDDIVTITRATAATRDNLYINTNFTPSMLNGDFKRRVLVEQQNKVLPDALGPRYNTSETLTLSRDQMMPVLPIRGAWRMNAAGTAIETFNVPDGSLAPGDAKYILQTADGDLPNAQALSPLASGFIVNTTTTGVVHTRIIQGITNQIVLQNGDGISANPTVHIAANPAMPGVIGMQVPTGTTAQRATPISPAINLRYNTDLVVLEYYDHSTSAWISAMTNVLLPVVDNSLSRFNGTTGQIQGSLVFIDDAGVVTGVTQLNVDNIRIDGNTITSTDANGDINITPNANGDIVLDGVKWPQADGTVNYVLKTDGAGQSSWTAAGISPSESTGLLTGGILSTGTAATEYSISDGTGHVIDADGTKTEVSWTGKSDITPVALLTHNISFVGITAAGAVVESVTAFTNIQNRTIISLGVAVHVNRTTVDAVNNEQHIAYNTNNQLNDLTQAIGFFNISGNVISSNGANLNIDKSAGDMYGVGVNYNNNIDDPNALTLAILTAVSFQYRFSDGSNGVTGIAIDPDNIDDGAGGLTALSNNKWAIQRVYSFTSNNVKIQRGQTIFNTSDEAIAGITSSPFVTEPSIAANGLLRGFIVIKKGATDLSDTGEAIFIEATRFQAASGGIGSSASTLQNVYDNSTPNPEILTNATQGALTIRRGSAADTDDILELQNNAATKTFSVTGNGVLYTAVGFEDTNSNELLDFASVASAINHLKLTNSATGAGPILEGVGDDPNVPVIVQTKGSSSAWFKAGSSTAGGIRMFEASSNGTDSVAIHPPPSVTASYDLILPAAVAAVTGSSLSYTDAGIGSWQEARTGTWTPLLYQSGSEISDATYNSSFTTGWFSRLNDACHFSMSFRLTAKGTVVTTTPIQISLPFTAGASPSFRGSATIYCHGSTGVNMVSNFTGDLGCLIQSTGNVLSIIVMDTAAGTSQTVDAEDIPATFYCQITGSFRI